MAPYDTKTLLAVLLAAMLGITAPAQADEAAAPAADAAPVAVSSPGAADASPEAARPAAPAAPTDSTPPPADAASAPPTLPATPSSTSPASASSTLAASPPATLAASPPATLAASPPATMAEASSSPSEQALVLPDAPSTTLPAPEAHEKIDTNAPSLLTQVPATRKQQWEAEQGGFTASRFAIANRLSERPQRLLTPFESLPRKRRDFLWRVARDTWNGLQAYTDRTNGLIIDNVRITGGLVPPLSLKVGDYTNITNIGLQVAAIVAARRLGLLPGNEARVQLTQLLDTLATLDRYSGLYFNYYDTTSMEPTSSFLSFVDTSWLVAGLMVARQGFPDLERQVNDILESIDLHWFYDDSTGLMSHGYYVNMGTLSAFEYAFFYTEARLGSLIAIGKGDAPPSHWFAMRRASRSRCIDGDCPELHHLDYVNAEGRTMEVDHFRWRSYEYVPSWGGSMFEALMPRLMLDEDRWAPGSLGPNGHAHAMLQKLVATEVLGLPVWGMSPCIDPITNRYHEYGVAGLGSHGYDEGVVTPHAVALALAVTPDDAAETLMELARRYPIYGPFGFYDAVEPRSGTVAYQQLALDQLMLFLSVANYLSNGEVQELFASDPWVKDALPLLAEERFFH